MADPATALNPVAYLTARLDEDEVSALAARVGPVDDGRWEAHDVTGRVEGGGRMVAGTGIAIDERDLDGGQADHIARWDPAVVLADIAAKRTMLTPHAGYHDCLAPGTDCSWTTSSAFRDIVLPALVAPYAVRPDFPNEWKINA